MSSCRPLLVILSVLLFMLLTEPGSGQEEQQEAKAQDRYTVPEGDVAALVKFVDELVAYRPATTEEILAHREKALKALQQAVDRILALETDPRSDAFRKARSFKLQFGLSELQRATEADQRKYYEQLTEFIQSATQLTQQDLALSMTAGQIIERLGNLELASELYTRLGERFAEHTDSDLARYGRKMLGVSRRLGLIGNEMELRGTTLAGEAFDWNAYRGKVVLVDYWATWCGPCIAELPNVKENYAKFRDKGFEVVGISLDEDRQRLEEFVKEREIPWVCLFEDGAGWEHPMASYYGVMGIPAMMLVDREGKVVSMNARGGNLERELTRLLGAIDAPADNTERDTTATDK